MNEKISELLDKELAATDQTALLRALNQQPALRRVWERYHLAGAALRNDLETLASADFADRVAAAIGAEPVQMSRWRWSGPHLPKVAQMAAGLALAASVAAVAIISLQPGPSPRGGSQLAGTQGSAVAQAGNLNTYLVEHGEYNHAGSLGGMMSYVRVVGYDSDK